MRSLLLALVLTPALFLGTANASEAAPPKLVPLNQASATELAAIEGVELGLAEEIVELRLKRGSLSNVEALRVIPGITDASLDALRSRTTIDIALPDAQTVTYDSVEAVLKEFEKEPSIQQVHAWAADYAKANPNMVDRWLAASRSFAALPEVTLEYRLQDGWDQGFFYVADDGTPLSLPDQEPQAILDDAGQDQDRRYLVRAKWELDKLVMSSERIRVLQEAQDIAKLRDKVLGDVTELYFERRRLQVEMLLNPSNDVKRQVRDVLQLQELTAGIDALTGGAFSAST